MTRPIAVGDLIMKVRPNACCGDSSGLGKVFVVAEIYTGRRHCRNCKTSHDYTTYLVERWEGIDMLQGGALISCIRIDPPALAESVTEEMEKTV